MRKLKYYFKKVGVFLIISLFLYLQLNKNPLNQSSLSKSNKHDLQIEFPHVLEMLTHLKNFSFDQIQPKRVVSSNQKRFVSLVIGVPTTKRVNATYLYNMLDSLFSAITNEDKNKILVVVLIAEKADKGYVENTTDELEERYRIEINKGFMEVVIPSEEFYPKFDNKSELTDLIYNDPPERIMWRRYQNYDFSYLMAYARSRGSYFLMLEDDVLSRNGFVSDILNFIQKVHNTQKEPWLMIEFSELGFIEYGTRQINRTKLGIREKCSKNLGKIRIKYEPSLFQHIGLHSSLTGKIQKAVDKKFRERLLFENHKNPDAILSTSLKVYEQHTLEKCYRGDDYFWSFNPSENDVIQFIFNEPFLLKKYYIKSGNTDHPGDMLPSDSKIKIKTRNSLFQIGVFNSKGIATNTVNLEMYGPINEFIITITKNASNWIILHEIAFFN